MYLRTDERRPPMTSGFALRVALLGGLALAMFAVIFFRLWYLQILSGDEYLAQANDNRIREIRLAAPRGEIVDRNGTVLVENRTSLALQVNPQELATGPARERELRRLAEVAGIPYHRIRREMHEQLRELPSAPVTLKSDIPYELVYYLQENQASFPGVEVARVFVRRYPQETLAAHLFGNVGEIDRGELRDPAYNGLVPGDLIGKDGVEYQYDRYLRGRPGASRVQVDSLGRPTGQLSSRPPLPGDNLRLTIDADLQAAGEAALASRGLPGAFVAMNVHNGEILAMGSSPTFDPTDLINPSQADVDRIYRDPAAAPYTNRAIAGLYPTGSTFKLVTAMAALNAPGLGFTPSTPIYDGGSIEIGDIVFSNAGGAAYGTVTLPTALQVSSDVFFYTLGADMNGTPALQRWARLLGMGRETGIDLPGEQAGLLPTPAWRNELYREGLTDRPWSVGDNVNLSVGQGDLQANPLQMAIAYATVANGGKVVRPHVGMQVEDPAGRVVQEMSFGPRRRVPVDPGYRAAILDGLHQAAQAPGGTSYDVFGGFPVPVAGKTGTAERPPHADQSWYLVLAPHPDPRVVVAVTFEEGGFGADTAAPAALEILSEYFEARARPVSDGGGPVE